MATQTFVPVSTNLYLDRVTYNLYRIHRDLISQVLTSQEIPLRYFAIRLHALGLRMLWDMHDPQGIMKLQRPQSIRQMLQEDYDSSSVTQKSLADLVLYLGKSFLDRFKIMLNEKIKTKDEDKKAAEHLRKYNQDLRRSFYPRETEEDSEEEPLDSEWTTNLAMEDDGFWLSGFYRGVYKAADDPSLDSIVSWSKSNKSFIIWNPKEFERQILSRSRAISCSNFSRFLSGLNKHGFKRVEGSEHLEFGHKEYFVRGKPELLRKMQKSAFLDRHHKAASKLARAKLAREGRAKELANGLHNMRI